MVSPRCVDRLPVVANIRARALVPPPTLPVREQAGKKTSLGCEKQINSLFVDDRGSLGV
jgi:hypothetical protein